MAEIHPFIQKHFSVNTIQQLSGGDINEVYLINDATVVKLNRSDDFPQMFKEEAKGLSLLSQHFKTPTVHQIQSNEKWQLLAMEYIQQSVENSPFWIDFGQKLAKTHQISQKTFGLDSDNFIGSLHQSNHQQDNWVDFLIEQRLQPMIEMAVNSGEVNYVEARIIESFYAKINEIYPNEPPALLHGDLWSGNYICSSEGAVLIDPAVYFGHREMDLGMMHLFGGFNAQLFASYHEIYPLEKGWKKRINYNQLYPLLVHVNLFGRSYWNQVYTILREFA